MPRLPSCARKTTKNGLRAHAVVTTRVWHDGMTARLSMQMFVRQTHTTAIAGALSTCLIALYSHIGCFDKTEYLYLSNND